MTKFDFTILLLSIAVTSTLGFEVFARDTKRLNPTEVAISTYEASIKKLNAQFLELAESELATANDKIDLLTKHYRNNADSEREKLIEKLRLERQRLKSEDLLAQALQMDDKIARYEKEEHSPPVTGASLLRVQDSKSSSPIQEKLESLQRLLAVAQDEASILPRDRDFISRLKGKTYQVTFTHGSGKTHLVTFNADGTISPPGKPGRMRWGVIDDRLIATFNPESGHVDIYLFNGDLTECGCYGAGKIDLSKTGQPGKLVEKK